MKNGLSGFKNILWAVSILLVLLALLVGLIFAMSQKTKEPRQDGTITLGEIERKSKKDDAELTGLDAAAEPQLKELPATSKNNMESVFGMTFLCDKTVAALKTYCDNYVDSVTAQIWTDNRTGLSAKAAAETPIVFVDGMTKDIFVDLALTVVFSLMASLFIALTLVPAMASIWGATISPTRPSRSLSRVTSA